MLAHQFGMLHNISGIPYSDWDQDFSFGGHVFPGDVFVFVSRGLYREQNVDNVSIQIVGVGARLSDVSRARSSTLIR